MTGGESPTTSERIGSSRGLGQWGGRYLLAGPARAARGILARMFLENIAPRRGRKSQNRNARNPGNVTSSSSSTQHGRNERLLSRLLPGGPPDALTSGTSSITADGCCSK